MVKTISLDWRTWDAGQRRLALGVLCGAAMPIASALLANALDTYLAVRAPSMTFLCSVILAAIWFGRHVAVGTALFAFFIYNFYLTEPRNTFGFAGWEDVLTLLVFVGVALLIGSLAGNLHDQRERAKEQVRVFSRLFTISREMAAVRGADEALSLLAAGTQQITGREAVVLSQENGEARIATSSPPLVSPPKLVAAAATSMLDAGGEEERVEEGWHLLRVQAGSDVIAVLAWRPQEGANSGDRAIAVRLLADVTGVGVERTRHVERQVALDTMAATDRLRTALMSSISHDFRTPLSTILASASSLQAYGEQFSPTTRADLLVSIQEEAERLNRFIGNILDMTRLEAGAVKPREEWVDPTDVIDAIEERMRKRIGERPFRIVAPAAAPAISVDPVLLEQAVVNVVENALVHTPPGSALVLGADYDEREVRLWVEDDGPGVSPNDLQRVFERFQRSSTSQNNQGAGLGLAISKGFVEAMRGQVRAVSPVRDGHGFRVEFVFPLETAMAPT